MMLNSLLSIDPGLHLGYAYFPKKKLYPTHAGLIVPETKGKDFFVNLHTTITQYASILRKFSPQVVTIEWPTVYSSVVGRAAAGSGSIVKLAFTIGKLAQVAEAYGSMFIPVPVVQWKGQLPKNTVIKRIQRILSVPRLKKLNPKKDCWDAIGIGLYVRGIF